MITYSISKGKVVLCKDGVYFALNSSEIEQLADLLDDVQDHTVTNSIYYRKDSRSTATKELDQRISNETYYYNREVRYRRRLSGLPDKL